MKFKAILALSITALFIATGFAALMPVQNANAQSAPTFSFPYSYGTPQVPSDVGAQGVQGPTVPNSSIGAQVSPSTIISQAGPVNGSIFPFSYITETLDIQLFNGTISSHSYSVGTPVTVTNVTFANSTTTKTNKYG